MLERLSENLRSALALLLQMDRTQQLRSMLLVLVFVFVANIASNAIYEALDLAWWVTPSVLVGLIVAVVLLVGWQRGQGAAAPLPRTGKQPAPHVGLIWCLSLFNAPGGKQEPGQRGVTWRREELAAALGAAEIDWPTVIERCTHSNLQPAIEAIGHHRRGGGGEHLWLITTRDLVDGAGKVVQEGSNHLAPLVARILHEGLGWPVHVHYEDERLQVMTYDTTAAYRAAEYVFTEAAAASGLAPGQVIADLTGGRVPATSGIVLACAPRGWAMQYTTTDRDPATEGVADRPVPLAIEVKPATVWLPALEAMRDEVEEQGG